MALRTSWEGFLKLSLISVPVRAYNAAVAGGGDIHFHQIHKDCGSRIRYQKVCPVHGEVAKEEIASGYEYEKNKYVEMEPQEMAQLKAANDQSINIDSFIPSGSLDLIYLSGRTFYLVPDGPAGQKAYALLHQVMKEKRRDAIGTMIISGHEETVLLRPEGRVLTLSVLYYDTQVKKSSDFENEVGESKISPQELSLAETLVEASTAKQVALGRYKDHYTERTRNVIEAKLAGKAVEAPRGEKSMPIINLMDALRKSVEEAKSKDKSPPDRARRAPRAPRKHSARRTG